MATKKTLTKDKKRWLVTAMVGVLLTGAVVGLSVKLNRVDNTKYLNVTDYSVGTLLTTTGKADKEAKGSIYTAKAVKVDGFDVDLKDNATVTYQLFWYKSDGTFLSSTSVLSDDFDESTIPSSAECVKIMITPKNDDDGEVSLLEVNGYQKQVTVKHAK